MLCDIMEKEKIICLYLSREERDDKQLRADLKPCCKSWKAAGYKVAILLSGDGDLTQNTIELLRYNKELSAKKEVQLEMKQRERSRPTVCKNER